MSTAHEQAAYGRLPRQQRKHLLLRFIGSVRGVQIECTNRTNTPTMYEFHRVYSVLPSVGVNSIIDRIQREDVR